MDPRTQTNSPRLGATALNSVNQPRLRRLKRLVQLHINIYAALLRGTISRRVDVLASDTGQQKSS